MSVSICFSSHQGHVLMNTEKAITNQRGVTNAIPAILGDGTACYNPFLGVIDNENPPKEAKPVKLAGVTRLWWNESAVGDDSVEIPENHFTKGFYFRRGYYIAISNDEPVTWASR